MFSSIFDINISGNVKLHNESPNETNHVLRIFAGTTVEYDRKSNGVFQHDLKDGDFKHSIHFTKALAGESAICFDLFATCSNYKGIPSCKRLATATIPVHAIEEKQTIKMLQLAAGRLHKADLSLDILCDMSRIDKVSISSSADHEEITRVLKKACFDDRQLTIKNVKGYDSFINRIRMVPWQTRTIAVPGPAYWDMKSLEITDSVLLQWLGDACHRSSTTVADFSKMVSEGAEGASGTFVGSILGSVCTIYPNTCTYVGDFVWDGGVKMNFDSYESIGTTNTGDCEDLTHGILQIFNAINNRIINRFSYGPLDALTAVAHRYTCVATLGEATKGSADDVFESQKCAHMWATLLPRHAMNKHAHTIDNDTCLLLEGTARVDPNINKIKSGLFADKMNETKLFSSMNFVTNMYFYTRVAHLYPSIPIGKSRTFGYSVVSPTPIAKNTLAKFGVTMEDLYHGRYSLWQHDEFDKPTIEAIEKVMAHEYPVIHMINTHETECENAKYLIENLNRYVQDPLDNKIESELYFINNTDLSRAACDNFINNVAQSGIHLTKVTSRVEFNNILCIRLSGYSTVMRPVS